MDTASYIVLSRQVGLFNQLDVIANNVANANTDGFKSESVMFKEYLASAGRDGKSSFANDVISVSDMSQGDLKATGRPLDAAINGEGYYSVQTPLGTRYTRSGIFHIDQVGQLSTKEGYPVLDGGSPIVFNETDKDVQIGQDGSITTLAPNGVREIKGVLSVYKFDNPYMMKKAGGNFYTSNEVPILAENVADYKIAQGMVEQSNVNSTKELTAMIKVNRSVGSTAKFITDVHDMQRKAISTISRMQ